MKRILLSVLASLVSAVCLSGQEAGSSVFEIGAGLNIYGTLGAMGGPYRYFSPGIYGEYRYGAAERFDIGAQLNYRFGNGESDYFVDVGQWKLRFNQVNLKAVADFKMRPSRAVRPFIGVGIGAGLIKEERIGDLSKVSWTVSPVKKWFFGTVGPRLGIHIKRFRVAIETDLAFDTEHWDSIATATALNVGYSF
ncbi:MAG: outer membrane beta-barrel protein [Bacteroidales bacterium]|nr:outer membrane beta-barrel protein [Bacteroidales bacterium]